MGLGIRPLAVVAVCLAAVVAVVAAVAASGHTLEQAAESSLETFNRGHVPAQVPQLFISPSGSDATCMRGSRSLPCATMTRAFDLARCGDTVEIGGGRYPDQQVSGRSAPRAMLDPGYVQARAGGTRSLSEHLPGRAGLRLRAEQHRHHRRRRRTADRGHRRLARHPPRADRGRLVHGSWPPSRPDPGLRLGACASSGTSGCSGVQAFVDTDRNQSQQTRDVIVRGNTFHDFDIVTSGDHFECLFVTGGTSITIEQNRFFNCETYDLLLAPRDWANFSGLVVRNNSFGLDLLLRRSLGAAGPNSQLRYSHHRITGIGWAAQRRNYPKLLRHRPNARDRGRSRRGERTGEPRSLRCRELRARCCVQRKLLPGSSMRDTRRTRTPMRTCSATFDSDSCPLRRTPFARLIGRLPGAFRSTPSCGCFVVRNDRPPAAAGARQR